MPRLSRLLKLARMLTGRSKGAKGGLDPCRRPARQTTLMVEELEVRVVPTLMGQQLFPADNPWNQNISNAPVAANSAAIISHIGSAIRLHPDWGDDSASNGNSPLYGIPFNVVHGNSTAKVNVSIDNYPGESDIVPVPIPAGAVIEGDYQNGPNPNGGGYNSGQRGDSHLIIWDEDTNIAYELYGVTRPGDPTLFPNTDGVELPHTDGQWHAAQETVWNMNTNTFRTIGATSADAAGLSILAGLVRPDEGLPTSQGGQGAIDHALRVTLPGGDVNPQYVYPASHMVSESQGADNLPLGGRLRLENTPAINALIADMPPESQIIARAMQQYGLIVADIGSAMFVTGASATVDDVDSPSTDLTWDMDNDILASNGLRALTAGDFQVVNLTPIVTGLSANGGMAGDTITITGQNFSGAAGNLSVLFGNTPSPTVTYVSDTQIIAVVPSGSGTVSVLVQSGIDETDDNSDNPNANVNAPIFGYGISQASTADLFAFSTQPIGSANSTANFANATVTSAGTDTLTIVVKDTSDNAVSGLSSSAFSFGLSGGTSGGTFGAVTASATAGTYTATFTGTTAGTASTLTVTVDGVALSATPSITVAAGLVSANSTVGFALPTIASGVLDTVTFVVVDGSKNPITGLASSAFILTLSGGTSAGTFSAVTETTTPGTYTATFTGTTAGTASTLTATVNGVILHNKPTVQVTVGAISATKSTVSSAKSTVTAGGTDLVTIVARDAGGNVIAGLPSSAFALSLAGASGGTFGAVTQTTTKGTYTATLTATNAGTPSTLTAIVNGTSLSSAPSVQVTAGGASGTKSTVNFAAATVASGATDTVTIVVKDAFGNAVTGLAGSAFIFSLTGVSTGTFGTVAESTTKGTYTSTFTANKAGTTSTLTTTVKGVLLTSKPTVQVTVGAVNSLKSTAGFAAATVACGHTDTVTITVKDSAGNAIGGLPNSAFNLQLSGGGSAGTLGAVTQTATKGTYTVTFTATTVSAGSALIVSVNGVTLASSPAVAVTPGGINASQSTASLATSSVASGNTDTLTIVVKNNSGAAVSGLGNASFVLSKSKGTSAGTFGSVTETATKGTYTVTFTGTTPGTADLVTVVVNGVTLTIKPTITVTPSASA